MFERQIVRISTLAVALMLSVPAFAHSHPVTMNPAPDTTVAAPTEVSILFSEDLLAEGSYLKLKDASGTIVSKETSKLDPKNAKHMTLALPRLAPGVYTLEWMTSTADGHHLNRSYTFTVK